MPGRAPAPGMEPQACSVPQRGCCLTCDALRGPSPLSQTARSRCTASPRPRPLLHNCRQGWRTHKRKRHPSPTLKSASSHGPLPRKSRFALRLRVKLMTTSEYPGTPRCYSQPFWLKLLDRYLASPATEKWCHRSTSGGHKSPVISSTQGGQRQPQVVKGFPQLVDCLVTRFSESRKGTTCGLWRTFSTVPALTLAVCL